ncbi:hypothetical protein C8R47DRAFT_1207054 [Mycena vitilis]|nr:hypothetical protein C8R47DRAFT_1207054 [Mycena vitilis]
MPSPIAAVLSLDLHTYIYHLASSRSLSTHRPHHSAIYDSLLMYASSLCLILPSCSPSPFAHLRILPIILPVRIPLTVRSLSFLPSLLLPRPRALPLASTDALPYCSISPSSAPSLRPLLSFILVAPDPPDPLVLLAPRTQNPFSSFLPFSRSTFSVSFPPSPASPSLRTPAYLHHRHPPAPPHSPRSPWPCRSRAQPLRPKRPLKREAKARRLSPALTFRTAQRLTSSASRPERKVLMQLVLQVDAEEREQDETVDAEECTPLYEDLDLMADCVDAAASPPSSSAHPRPQFTTARRAREGHGQGGHRWIRVWRRGSSAPASANTYAGMSESREETKGRRSPPAASMTPGTGAAGGRGADAGVLRYSLGGVAHRARLVLWVESVRLRAESVHAQLPDAAISQRRRSAVKAPDGFPGRGAVGLAVKKSGGVVGAGAGERHGGTGGRYAWEGECECGGPAEDAGESSRDDGWAEAGAGDRHPSADDASEEHDMEKEPPKARMLRGSAKAARD